MVPPEDRARERLQAAGALAAITVAVLGIPVVLALVLGPPIRSGSGAGGVVRAILSLLFWAAWAHFIACLVAEWRAEVRGSGLAPRIPFGGAPQMLARRLVVTALLLSGTTALVVPATYGQETARGQRPGPGGVLRGMPAPGPRPELAPPRVADGAGLRDGTTNGLDGPGAPDHPDSPDHPDTPDGVGSTAQASRSWATLPVSPAARPTWALDGASPRAGVSPPDELPGDGGYEHAPYPGDRYGDVADPDGLDGTGPDGTGPDGVGPDGVGPDGVGRSDGVAGADRVGRLAGVRTAEFAGPVLPAQQPVAGQDELPPPWPGDRPELISPAADQHSRLVLGERMVKLYEVRPADGRHHDTLWGIAERFLGDGLRYREIFDLNEGRTQPDGRTLSKPSLIHAGWVLLLPADAQGDGLRVLRMPEGTAEWPQVAADPAGDGELAELFDHDSFGDAADADDDAAFEAWPGAADDRYTAHDRDTADDRQTAGDRYAPDNPFASSRLPSGPDAPEQAAGPMLAASLAPPQDFLGVAAAGLLAAGVMVALSGRRSGPAQPPQDATERALLLASDTEAARFIDRSLRVLSAALTEQARLLPAVYAAILTEDALILHMAPAQEEPPPPPWAVGEVPGSWWIERTPELLAVSGDGSFAQPVLGVPAPFPALVSFGHDDAGSRILVDLEGAPGVISLLGDRVIAMQVVIAVALELATNVWSDDLRVCLIGFPADDDLDELLTIAPERLWTAVSVAEALDELSGPDDEDAVLDVGAYGDDFPLEAGQRIAGNPGALAPDLLVLAEPPAEADIARLARMAQGRRHAVGVLTVGDSPAARWRFTVGPDRRMSLGVLGVEVWAQSISGPECRAIAALFRAADAATVPAPAGPAEDEPPPQATPAPASSIAAPPAPPPLPPPAMTDPARAVGAAQADPGEAVPAPAQPTPDDEITRPPARADSVPGVLPWTPPLAAIPPATGSQASAPASADEDLTRPPANGRRAPLGPPPVPLISPGGPASPERAASPHSAASDAEPAPGRVTPSAPAPTPFLAAPGDAGPHDTDAMLLSHPSSPLIRPTDIPRVPPVLYFETPRMRANRAAQAQPQAPAARGAQTAGAATPSPPPPPPPPAATVPGASPPPGTAPTATALPASVPQPAAPAPATAMPGTPLGSTRSSIPPERVPTPPRPTPSPPAAPPPRPPIPPPNERPSGRYPTAAPPREPSSAPPEHSGPPSGQIARPQPPVSYSDGETTTPRGRTWQAGPVPPSPGTAPPSAGPPSAGPASAGPATAGPATAAPEPPSATGLRPVRESRPDEPMATGEAQVRVLGVPTVEGPGRQPTDDLDLLTEIAVYLALHREGAHRRLLAEEIWPADAEADDDAVDAALGEARRWLGADVEGRPRLSVDPQGRWRLSSDVRCDWELFVAYTHRAGMPGGDTEADLTTALRMVSGPLWTNLPTGRYRWATTGPIARSTRAGVVDVAHRLAELTLGFGDTMTAMAACRTGLRAVPASEALWRDLLRTVSARGDRRTLEAVTTEMYRTIGAGGGRRGGRAEAETDALVQTLLPGFRRARK
ncbi:LysM peptidoglycan-binding domain-containing protein [Frankia sp. AvcI1]|uniref:LysM peptidoglycan-binding domain-containing protein n=1 Tax=Frankia sp. AvcI1 TaxID=573496 RepID=UPI002118C4FA|nr:LysM peptidoglycan-binding domain-containing protein [Frankia sp. AvcI1]